MSSWQFEAAVDTSKVTFQLDSHIAKSQAAILVHILCLRGIHPWTVDQCYTLQKENNMKRYSWEGTVPKPKPIQFFLIFDPQWGWQGQWSSVEWAMIGLRSPSPLPSCHPPTRTLTTHHPSYVFYIQFFHQPLPPKKRRRRRRKV